MTSADLQEVCFEHQLFKSFIAKNKFLASEIISFQYILFFSGDIACFLKYCGYRMFFLGKIALIILIWKCYSFKSFMVTYHVIMIAVSIQ